MSKSASGSGASSRTGTLPKGEFAKEANRYSGKGPGKLAFYCDACKRQCGDKLGYERHCSSKLHNDRVQWIAENAEQYLTDNSLQFESQFLGCLKLRAGEPVEMNTLYQDLIHIRDHVHLKATKWNNLTEFVRDLDGTKKCKVDFVEGKGWHLTYVEQDANLVQKQQFAAAKKNLISNSIATQSQKYYARMGGNGGDDEGNDSQEDWNDNSHHTSTTTTTTGQIVSGIQLNIAHHSATTTNQHNKEKGVKSMWEDDDDDDDDGDDNDDNDTVSNVLPHQTTQPTTSQNTRSNLETQAQVRKTPHPDTPNDHTTVPQHSIPAIPAQQSKPAQSEPKWVEREAPSGKAPWMRKGLKVKVTNEKLENGRYYGYKGTITNIFTSINKKLIPVDLSYKVNKKSKTRQLVESEDDDEEEEEITLTRPDQTEVCVDYSYTVVCEVTVMVDSMNGDEKGANSDGLVAKKILLPQGDIQTTMPKEYELDEKGNTTPSSAPAPAESKLLLSPSLLKTMATSNPKRFIGCVNGVYSEDTSDRITLVRIIQLDSNKYQAEVELLDPFFKTLKYDRKRLLQLENWETLVLVSLGSVEDNPQSTQSYTQLDPATTKDSLYKSTVWLSYDDLCMIDLGE